MILPHGINIVIVNLGLVIMRVKLLMLVNIMIIIGHLLLNVLSLTAINVLLIIVVVINVLMVSYGMEFIVNIKLLILL